MSGYGYVWTAPAWRLPLSGGKQTFVLDVRFSADYVRFSPKSGRIDTVTVESARDPKRTFVGPKRQNLSLSGSPRLLILVRLKNFSRKLRQARRTG